MSQISYEERLRGCNKPILKKLFRIIIEKKTNLCLAANFETFDEILNFIEQCGACICILKIQHERIKGFTEDQFRILYEKKKQYNFLLFEDRKFFDDQDTIYHIYKTKYVKYVDLVTVMPDVCVTKAIEKAITEANLPEDEPHGYLVVCQVTFSITTLDTVKTLDMAKKVQDSSMCAGIIAQTIDIPDKCNMIKASPGVHLTLSKDDGSQNWNHPSKVIGNGADVLVVGRGITTSPKEKLKEVTQLYKETCWNSYLEIISK